MKRRRRIEYVFVWVYEFLRIAGLLTPIERVDGVVLFGPSLAGQLFFDAAGAGEPSRGEMRLIS